MSGSAARRPRAHQARSCPLAAQLLRRCCLAGTASPGVLAYLACAPTNGMFFIGLKVHAVERGTDGLSAPGHVVFQRRESRSSLRFSERRLAAKALRLNLRSDSAG